jgi:ABC-2 type transport system ATP-binding protein
LQECCAEKPKTVIVSTHIIDEIAKVAEQLIIDKGQLVLFCDMNEVDEKAYSVVGLADVVKAATKGLRVLGETIAGGFLSRCIYDRRIEGDEGYSVSSLGLQDFFIGLVGGENEKEAM